MTTSEGGVKTLPVPQTRDKAGASLQPVGFPSAQSWWVWLLRLGFRMKLGLAMLRERWQLSRFRLKFP